MKNRIIFFSLLFFSSIAQTTFAQFGTIVFLGNGGDDNWENPANWNLNRVPNANDDVTFASNQTVTINANTTIRSIFLDDTHLLAIKGELTIKGGDSITGIGMRNNAVVDISDNGKLLLEDIAKTGILNFNSIIVHSNREIRFRTETGNHFYANAAIDNRGEIVNEGFILLSQDFEEQTTDEVIPEKALINSGMIRNLGTLEMDDILENRSSGTIENEGSLHFEVRTGLLGDNDEALNQGTVTNKANADFNINRLINKGQITNEINGSFRSDALFNKGQFTNAGSTTLEFYEVSESTATTTNTGDWKMFGEMELIANSTFNNQGTFTQRQDPFADGGVAPEANLLLSGKLINSATGTMSFGDIIVDIFSTGILENSGIIHFGFTDNLSAVPFQRVSNKGLLDNKANATINLNQFFTIGRQFWLDNQSTSLFRNAGNIFSTTMAEDDYPDTVIINQGNIENLLGGKLELHFVNSINVGIFNQGTFQNEGDCTIGKTSEAVVKAIVNEARFINKSPANLFIDNATIGIENAVDAEFTNQAGDIFIGQSVAMQLSAIINKGTFASSLVGALVPSIIIEETGDDGLINETGATFSNNGIMRIGVSGSIGRSGLFNKGTFRNESQGRVAIETVGTSFPQAINGGISNDGNFSNTGEVDIKNFQNEYRSIINRTNASFTNNPCGEVKSPIIFDNLGTILNNGFWESTAQNSHSNEGTFTNRGILEDHFDSFSELGDLAGGNAVVNQGVFVQPIFIETDDQEINPTFTLGDDLASVYRFGTDPDEVFDGDNQQIGTFDIFDNIDLFNPLALGEHELRFQATDDNNFCTTDLTLFVTVEPEFSCSLTPNNATNANNNGAITTTIQGGIQPFTFAWRTPDDSEPTTQNLDNLPAGNYALTVTDALGETTTCETTVGMVSQSPDCGAVTITWDGGLMHDANGQIIRDDNTNEPIFFGDGVSWNDPKNWRNDQVPTAVDVVGGFNEVGVTLPANRQQINLNVDASVKGFNAINIGLTIPLNRTLTVECIFHNNLFINSGKLVVTAGTADIGNTDFVNNGEIEVTGIGSDDQILRMVSTNNPPVNNGIIKVNNLSSNGSLLTSGSLNNSGQIMLENGNQAILGTVTNQPNGTIFVDNVNVGILNDVENEGEIFIDEAKVGIQGNFQNKQDGFINLNNCETCINVLLNGIFTNQGQIKIGSRFAQFQGDFAIGVLNEGTFINEDSLIIDGCTTIGIQNENDFSASTDIAPIFINEVGGHIEINGRVDTKGQPLPDVGVLNLEAIFENRNDLFIKDIKTAGIRNIGRRSGFDDVPDDVFRNEGVISINFIGVNHNRPNAKGIHNTEDGQFINENEILIGTFKGDFTNGGKIKGVGIHCEPRKPFFGVPDSSRFVNNKLIKIDNIISGGEDTGHGLLYTQFSSRFTNGDAGFTNKGNNPFGTGLLQIGGHKRVAGSGIRIRRTNSGIVAPFVNEEGATIRINQTGKAGISMAGQGNRPTEFNNDGLLTIGDQITVEGDGIENVNSIFKNLGTGIVEINALNGDAIEVINDTEDRVLFDNALFANQNIVRIGNRANIRGRGVEVLVLDNDNSRQQAEFRNLEGASLEIDRCGRSAIAIEGSTVEDLGFTEFENHGVVKIGLNTPANAPIGEHGIELVDGRFISFTPNTGNVSLEIDNVFLDGISMNKSRVELLNVTKIGLGQGISGNGINIRHRLSVLSNRSDLTIKKVGQTGINVREGDASSNNPTTIEDVGSRGISLQDEFTRFINNAPLEIGKVSSGAVGVELLNKAQFLNNSTLKIEKAAFTGIFNEGSYNNNGASSITKIVGCDTAIINHQALFNFNNAAQLLLKEFKVGLINEQATSEAAFVSSTGLIRFENSPATAQDLCFQNRNNGAIFNSSCGQMELFGTFENSSLILNQAFFRMMPTLDFTIITIDGTFNNEGIIEDIQGKLQTNSINNTDAILRPTCLGNARDGTIFEVVQLGSNLSFTIDTDWKVANVGTGIFDANTNTTTFQHPVPNQPIIATFTVTDDANNCTLNLSESLDFTPNNQAIPINAGDDQTNLCTLNTLLSGNSPNQNTTGIWSFTDSADGAGIIFEPTNPKSEFSGNFGQDYTLRWTQNATCGSGSDEVLIAFNGDTDNDFICDDEDVCADGDDRVDNNNNGIPDACEGGNTPCSEDNVTINEKPIVAGTFHARQNLTSSGIIATNTDVVFKAGTSITLQAGFSANAGSNFLATIEACPATLVTREMDSQALNRNDFENHGSLKAHLPQKASVEVFPNPVHHYTTIAINLPKTTSIQLDLHDLNGRKVANLFVGTSLKKGAHLFEWQCDQVKTGMYLVVLNGQIKTKLVIVN